MNNSFSNIIFVLFLVGSILSGAAENTFAQAPVVPASLVKTVPKPTPEEQKVIKANKELRQALEEYYDSFQKGQRKSKKALENLYKVMEKNIDITRLEDSPFSDTLNRYLYFVTDKTQTDPLMNNYTKCLKEKITFLKKDLDKRKQQISDIKTDLDQFGSTLEKEIAQWNKLQKYFNEMPSNKNNKGFGKYQNDFKDLEKEAKSLAVEGNSCLRNAYLTNMKRMELYDFIENYQKRDPETLENTGLKSYLSNTTTNIPFQRWKKMDPKERALAESLYNATTVEEASNAILIYWKDKKLKDTLDEWNLLISKFKELNSGVLAGKLYEIKGKVIKDKTEKEFNSLTMDDLITSYCDFLKSDDFSGHYDIINDMFLNSFKTKFPSEYGKKNCKELLTQWGSICNKLEDKYSWNDVVKPQLQEVFYYELEKKLPLEIKPLSFKEIIRFWNSLDLSSNADSLFRYSPTQSYPYYPVHKSCRTILSDALSEAHKTEVSGVEDWNKLISDYWSPVKNFSELDFSKIDVYKDRITNRLLSTIESELENKSCKEMQEEWDVVCNNINDIPYTLSQSFNKHLEEKFGSEIKNKNVKEVVAIWKALPENAQQILKSERIPALESALTFELSGRSCQDMQKKWSEISKENYDSYLFSKYSELIKERFEKEISGKPYKDVVQIVNNIDFNKIPFMAKESSLETLKKTIQNEFSGKSPETLLDSWNSFPSIEDAYFSYYIKDTFRDLLKSQIESEIKKLGGKTVWQYDENTQRFEETIIPNLQPTISLWKKLKEKSIEANFPSVAQDMKEKIKDQWNKEIENSKALDTLSKWNDVNAEDVSFLCDTTKDKIKSQLNKELESITKTSDIIPIWISIKKLPHEESENVSLLSDEIIQDVIIPKFESHFENQMTYIFTTSSFLDYIQDISEKLEKESIEMPQRSKDKAFEKLDIIFKNNRDSLKTLVSQAKNYQDNSSKTVQEFVEKLKKHIEEKLTIETLKIYFHSTDDLINFKNDLVSLGIKISPEVKEYFNSHSNEADSNEDEADGDDDDDEEEELEEEEAEEEEE